MKPFDPEQRKAYKAVETTLGTQRTVGIHTIALACERETDPRWITKIQDALPLFVKRLNEKGIPAVEVNRYCVRAAADRPIHDLTEAKKCVIFRSGGHRSVGIRRVLPDDLVLEAHLRVWNDLGSANSAIAIKGAVVAEKAGYIRPSTSQEMVAATKDRIETVGKLPAPPTQPRLLGSPDEDDEE